MNVYIVTNKPYSFPEEKGYIPIQVGIGKDICQIRDNTMDNICDKNTSFCELTAAYWIWKNIKADIVGLVHYRRYFFHNGWDKSYDNLLAENEIEDLLEEYDIIVPEALYLFHDNVYEHYARGYHIEDYDNCRGILEKYYPQYISYFDHVSAAHKLIPCNMIIAKKEVFDEYCEWVFDILFKLEHITDTSSYDAYNKRIFGFVSERLFTVWIIKNKHYKVKKYPIINIEDNNYRWNYCKNIIRKWVLEVCRKNKCSEI